ncbi:mucin-5AC-like [Actinia tenebrosa]|uniref:Mucin-5AC-like n=1 Tax=Actinia tenebrosa TaxID=6105 RepID=A0A6P8IRG5_ACTTE|nr:mucin-5AC-like [Actinia tenebrosa]
MKSALVFICVLLFVSYVADADSTTVAPTSMIMPTSITASPTSTIALATAHHSDNSTTASTKMTTTPTTTAATTQTAMVGIVASCLGLYYLF